MTFMSKWNSTIWTIWLGDWGQMGGKLNLWDMGFNLGHRGQLDFQVWGATVGTMQWALWAQIPKVEQGYIKLFYHVSNAQTQKYKYANTQIHKYSIWQSARYTPHMVYFWKEDCSEVSKVICKCVKHANTKIQKYKSQIHKYSKWWSARKTQHVAYFWKEDC